MSFAETGVSIVEGLIAPDDIARLFSVVQALTDMQARSAGLPAGLDVTDLPTEYRSGVYDAVNSHPEIYRLAGSPRIVSIADRLINGADTNEIIVNGFQLRMDLPGNQSELLGWHRDHDYFSNLPKNGVVLWLPLTDIDVDSGGISIVPRPIPERESVEVFKHWPGRKPHRVFEIKDADHVLEESPSPVRMTCKAGDGVFFSLWNMHRSEPNRSDRARWTLQYRYFSASEATASKLDRATIEARG